MDVEGVWSGEEGGGRAGGISRASRSSFAFSSSNSAAIGTSVSGAVAAESTAMPTKAATASVGVAGEGLSSVGPLSTFRRFLPFSGVSSPSSFESDSPDIPSPFTAVRILGEREGRAVEEPFLARAAAAGVGGAIRMFGSVADVDGV